MNKSGEIFFKKKIILVNIIFLSLIALNNCSYSQSRGLRFEHLSVEQGLSQSVVKSIVQDSRGYLWFGTKDGLNRYDGYNLVIYRHNPAVPSSLSDNAVECMYADNNGNLWIGTSKGGINKFDYKTEKFSRLSNYINNTESILSTRINSICEDKNGHLWIGTDKGLNEFNSANNKYRTFRHNPKNKNSLGNNYIKKIFIDNDNIMWVATVAGLCRFDSNQEIFINSFPDVVTIYEDRESILWLGTLSNGVIRFNKKNNDVRYFRNNPADPNSISNNNIRYILEDGNRNIWVGTLEGLNRFNRKTNPRTGQAGSFIRYYHKEEDYNSLSSNEHYSVYEDREGNLWFGTFGGGVNKLNLNQEIFIYYKHYPNVPGSLSDNYVSSISMDIQGNLWVGTDIGGLNKLDKSTGKFINYTHKPADKNSLSSNTILAISTGRSEKVWAGTYFGGLNEYDLKTNKFFHFCVNTAGDPHCLNSDIVTSILEDGDSVLWIGTDKGLNKLIIKKKVFTHYIHNPASSNSISDNNVQCLQLDRSGILWIGTSAGGLNKLDPKTEIFTHYKYNQGSANSICSNNIIAVYEDNSNPVSAAVTSGEVIWIGTDNGLTMFDKAKGLFKHYTKEDGLANNYIHDIIADNSGCLWLSTNNGLSKLNPKTGVFKNYSIKDGLQGNEFNQNACYKDKNGTLYFGGMNGFNVFQPDNINNNFYEPPVILTSFKKFNQEVKFDKAFSELKEIELSYKDYDVSFEFASLSFTQPWKNQYAYKLEGLDKDWVYSGTRRFATYTNLEPGTYTFKAKATNNDGVWSKNEASLRVIITPPWWKTGWAYALYILLIASGMFAIRKFQNNRAELRHELKMREFEAKKLQELEVLKSRFFANLSHEFRTPLMLIKGPVEQLLNEWTQQKAGQNGTDQLQMIQCNSQKLQELIDQLLELSQLEAASIPLKAKQENLLILLRGIVSSFESLASQKNIKLIFYGSEELTSKSVWLDRDKFEKIINNLLSNAFKFTGEGGTVSVLVDLDNTKQQAEIKISDSGIGIPEDQLDKIFNRFYQVDDSSRRAFGGSGIGLALVKELVDLHKWKIDVKSDLGKGTEFNLIVLLENESTGEVVSYRDEIERDSEAIIPDFQLAEDLAFEKSKTGAGNHTLSQNIFLKNLSILIVEDSQDVRKYLSGLLKSYFHDFEVIHGKQELPQLKPLQENDNGRKLLNLLEAENGEEGLKIAVENTPDLIISDIMMPYMDGIEFCRRIKTHWETSHIPVILLTAKATSESRIEGLETGADDYLTKPFDSKELYIRVKNLLEQRQHLRDKFSKEIKIITPSGITTTSLDNEFLNKAYKIVENNIANTEFDSEAFAKEMFVSRSQLHRKLLAITGQPPGEFLRSFRLKRAAQLLLEKRLSVTQVAFEVGFNNPPYFTKAFRQQYGCLPSEFTSKISVISNQ